MAKGKKYAGHRTHRNPGRHPMMPNPEGISELVVPRSVIPVRLIPKLDVSGPQKTVVRLG